MRFRFVDSLLIDQVNRDGEIVIAAWLGTVTGSVNVVVTGVGAAAGGLGMPLAIGPVTPANP